MCPKKCSRHDKRHSEHHSHGRCHQGPLETLEPLYVLDSQNVNLPYLPPQLLANHMPLYQGIPADPYLNRTPPPQWTSLCLNPNVPGLPGSLSLPGTSTRTVPLTRHEYLENMHVNHRRSTEENLARHYGQRSVLQRKHRRSNDKLFSVDSSTNTAGGEFPFLDREDSESYSLETIRDRLPFEKYSTQSYMLKRIKRGKKNNVALPFPRSGSSTEDESSPKTPNETRRKSAANTVFAKPYSGSDRKSSRKLSTGNNEYEEPEHDVEGSNTVSPPTDNASHHGEDQIKTMTNDILLGTRESQKRINDMFEMIRQLKECLCPNMHEKETDDKQRRTILKNNGIRGNVVDAISEDFSADSKMKCSPEDPHDENVRNTAVDDKHRISRHSANNDVPHDENGRSHNGSYRLSGPAYRLQPQDHEESLRGAPREGSFIREVPQDDPRIPPINNRSYQAPLQNTSYENLASRQKVGEQFEELSRLLSSQKCILVIPDGFTPCHCTTNNHEIIKGTQGQPSGEQNSRTELEHGGTCIASHSPNEERKNKRSMEFDSHGTAMSHRTSKVESQDFEPLHHSSTHSVYDDVGVDHQSTQAGSEKSGLNVRSTQVNSDDIARCLTSSSRGSGKLHHGLEYEMSESHLSDSSGGMTNESCVTEHPMSSRKRSNEWINEDGDTSTESERTLVPVSPEDDRPKAFPSHYEYSDEVSSDYVEIVECPWARCRCGVKYDQK